MERVGGFGEMPLLLHEVKDPDFFAMAMPVIQLAEERFLHIPTIAQILRPKDPPFRCHPLGYR